MTRTFQLEFLDPNAVESAKLLAAMVDAGTGSGYCTKAWLGAASSVQAGLAGLLVLRGGRGIRAALPFVARDRLTVGPVRLVTVDSLPAGAIGGYWAETAEDLGDLLACDPTSALGGALWESTHVKTFVPAASLPLWESPAHRRALSAIPLAVLQLPVRAAELVTRYEVGHRRNLRAAQKADCEIRLAQGTQDIDEFYELVTETMSRVGERPRVSFEFYREVSRRLLEGGWGVLYLAISSQRPIAGLFIIRDRRRSYYWLGGMRRSEEVARLRPMFALFHASFTAAVEAGQTEFELGGMPTDGLRRFKLGWGAVVGQYVEYHRINSRLAPVRNLYRSFRELNARVRFRHFGA